MKPIIKFYRTELHLIQYNGDTKKYKIRNTVDKDNIFLCEEEFKSLNPKQIKRQEFSRLMNIFFKDVKDTWVYDFTTYEKYGSFYNDLIIGKDVPLHKLKYNGYGVLVYHWGRVYYHTISYNGGEHGALLDVKTQKFLRWANIKHCSAVRNKVNKRLI